ncbi:Methyltransferase-like protein 21D [Mortierella claussenii]|nr:Methyltransferase-like protein 21D [Mortierella claussenii]
MDSITLASREYEFNHDSIEPLNIDEDPSGLLRGGVGSTIWDAAIVLSKYLEKSNLLSLISSSTAPATAEPRSLNILELGSGTGIVGLAAARLLGSRQGLKGHVVLTDKDNVVPLLARNVDKNPSKGVQIKASVLDWEVISGIKATQPQGSAEAASDSSLGPQAAPSETSVPVPALKTETKPSLSDTADFLAKDWDLVILSDCIWVSELYKPLIGTLNVMVPPGSKAKLVIAFEKRNFSEEMEFFALLGNTFRFRDIKPEDQDANYQSEDIYLFVCQRR